MIFSGSTNKPVIRLEYVTETAFRLFAQDVQVATKSSSNKDNFSLRLVRDGVAKTWTGYYKLDGAATWTLVGTFKDGEHGVPVITEPKAGLFARTPGGTMNARFDYLEVIAADQPPVYGPEIKLDVDQAMRLTNSSIYMRMPFTVTGDPQRFDEMILTARYDDGFRAFLNGIGGHGPECADRRDLELARFGSLRSGRRLHSHPADRSQSAPRSAADGHERAGHSRHE